MHIVNLSEKTLAPLQEVSCLSLYNNPSQRFKNSLDPTAGGEPLKPRYHERVHLLTGAHPKSRHLMMIVLIVVMMNVVLILEDGDSIGARPKSCHLMIVFR